MASRTLIEWRGVPGCAGYSVTSDGRIRGIAFIERDMKQMVASSGHRYVIARVDGHGQKLFLHRAVLLAFVGPCPDGMETRHLDGDPSNNAATNLTPHLLATPAAVRFISAEPLLAPIDLTHIRQPLCDPRDALAGAFWGDPGFGEVRYEVGEHPRLDWVIVGGESGPQARLMDLDWLTSLVEQCHSVGVPVFTKQDSGPRPGMQGRIPDELRLREWPR